MRNSAKDGHGAGLIPLKGARRNIFNAPEAVGRRGLCRVGRRPGRVTRGGPGAD